MYKKKVISTSRKPILFVSLSLPFIPFMYSIHQNSVIPVKAHCMQAVECGSHIKGWNTKENRCCVLKSEANEMQAGCFCRQVLAKKMSQCKKLHHFKREQFKLIILAKFKNCSKRVFVAIIK